MNEAKRKKRKSILFKVDFEKAYDSEDGGYLQFLMKKNEILLQMEAVDYKMSEHDNIIYFGK